MLSICIPVYQFHISRLIKVLSAQIVEVGIPIELLVIDDGSEEKFRDQNRKFVQNQLINYQELPQNMGRAKIRNLLAHKAQFEYLLFLDCDVIPVEANFLKRYIEAIKNQSVVYGGTVYSPSPPQDQDFLFHWRYGKAKEEISSQKRSRHPYATFKTNNFLVSKNLFFNNLLEENLTGYGHEDSLFAFSLKAQGIAIQHIHNPVLHEGLIPADELVTKLESSLENLIFLEKLGKPVPVKIYKWYRALNGIRNIPFAKKYLRQQKSRLRKLLLNPKVPLQKLDLYKLCYILDL